MPLPQRLSAERNTSDSDSVGVSTAENCRENGETETPSLKSIQQLFDKRILSQSPPRYMLFQMHLSSAVDGVCSVVIIRLNFNTIAFMLCGMDVAGTTHVY